MNYFDDEERIEITEDVLANFSSSDDTELYDELKSAEDYRAERLAAKAERRRKKKLERRSKLLNNLMPVAALVLLVCTVSYLNTLQFGLVITYNDRQIATVENAGVVDEATSIINNKIILKSLDTLEAEPQYRVAIIDNKSEMQNSTELSRAILANDGALEDEICGVFVDGTFVGAVSSKEDAQAVLDDLIAAEKVRSKGLGDVVSAEFNSNIALEVGLYAKDSIVDKSVLKDRLVNNVELSYTITVREEKDVKIRYKTEYVVDSSKPSGYEQVTTKGQIGEGVVSNLVTYIDGSKVSTEREKVTATKKPVKEIITVSADNENAANAKTAEELKAEQDKANNSSSDGEKPNTSDAKSNKDEKSESTESEITDSDKDTDTSSKQSSSENEQKADKSFIWPAPACGSITNEFGYNGGEKLHKGIDISGSGAEGQSIVAAASGYVTTVVIDYGNENYGCYLVIDHGNGYQTLYAQCSDIYVASGTYVEQGDVIAAVGSTGDSTGAHLHFEIIQNGEYVNPTNYLY